MTIKVIKFTGKLPYSIRPLRGAARKNKRHRKRYEQRNSARVEMDEMVKRLDENIRKITGVV